MPTLAMNPGCAPPACMQVAQVRAEDREGQPQPAQLLQVHRAGLPRAQAGERVLHLTSRQDY